MNYFKIHNYLDGKNICNIFANLIVNKIHKEVPDAKTEITVTNVRNFFIVKGCTSYDKTIDLSDLLRNFYSKNNSTKINDVRVFDLISYNKTPENKSINTSISSDKLYDIKQNELQNFVNNYVSKNILFNFEYLENENIIYYDCNKDNISQVVNILEKKFESCVLLKVDMSNECFMSDRIYGLSPNLKVYDLLLINIKNHIFKLGLGKKFTCHLNSMKLPNDVENEDMFLNIEGDNFMVPKKWLESLILDVFPFEYEKVNSEFGNKTDLEDFIMTGKCQELEETKYIKDFILI